MNQPRSSSSQPGPNRGIHSRGSPANLTHPVAGTGPARISASRSGVGRVSTHRHASFSDPVRMNHPSAVRSAANGRRDRTHPSTHASTNHVTPEFCRPVNSPHKTLRFAPCFAGTLSHPRRFCGVS